MTTRQADKLIAAGKPVTFYDPTYCDTFIGTPVRRDRRNLYIIHPNGREGTWDRADLVVKTK